MAKLRRRLISSWGAFVVVVAADASAAAELHNLVEEMVGHDADVGFWLLVVVIVVRTENAALPVASARK